MIRSSRGNNQIGSRCTEINIGQIPSERGNSEQSGEGPGPSGGITISGIITPNAKSALGEKGVKRKLKVQTIETKYKAIVAVEKGEKTKTAIAEQNGVPLNTLSTWLKNKEKIMNVFHIVTMVNKCILLFCRIYSP